MCRTRFVSAEQDQFDVQRVLAGDPQAFEGIVRRWQKPLVNLAYRFCRDRARAEEMAQESFLRAFRNLKQWRGDSAFSTWLFALATNVYRNELKRVPVFPLLEAEVASTADVTAESQERRTAEAVRSAVLSLPEKYRSGLLLFYFHGMDVSQAASSLQIPEGTLKARLARGREMLRSKLAKMKGRYA